MGTLLHPFLSTSDRVRVLKERLLDKGYERMQLKHNSQKSIIF